MDVQAGDHVAARSKKWTDANLETQGYDLAELRRRRGLAVGLRFTGLASRHPFDLIWVMMKGFKGVRQSLPSAEG